MKIPNLHISLNELKIEKEQLVDEGKDITSVENEFDELLKSPLDNNMSLQQKVNQFLDKTIKLPQAQGYKYIEPSDLENIKKQRPAGPRKIKLTISDARLLNRVKGAWLGRCSGCLLGKPVEGWKTPKLWGFLKDTKNYPLKKYMSSKISSQLIKKYEINTKLNTFINSVKGMPEDDDTNYTITGLVIMKNYGKSFKPEDVANFWINNIPAIHTWSAERVAYKNFLMQIGPPESASYRNPYREWIGAQIRADFFGYTALGNPELAAEFAFRDACISHVKNGIYGEMWVSAMLASACVENDIIKVIEIGLSEIPEKSRLAEGILQVLDWYKEKISVDEAIKRIHKKWNENNGHHWCHTISNAQIVALGLLWGKLDFEKTICFSVQCGFDTDCNGATAGSVLGMLLGAKKLPEKWIKPLKDNMSTGISGYGNVSISKIAKEGFEIFKKINS